MGVKGGGTVIGRDPPCPRAVAGGSCREDRPAVFAAAGHVFTSPEVALDRPPALFQAAELLGDRAHAQHAGVYREGLLLPLSAALAYSARWLLRVEQSRLCSLHASRQVGAQALLPARTHQKRYDITWLDNGVPSRKEQLPLPADRDH